MGGTPLDGALVSGPITGDGGKVASCASDIATPAPSYEASKELHERDTGRKGVREEQSSLLEHGARQITFDYNDDGTVSTLSFTIAVEADTLHIRMPARTESARELLRRQYEQGLIPRKEGKKVYSETHAYRVAWRNILDWLEVQMALLDIGMVKIEEIFLPYVLTPSGTTVYEEIEGRHFHLPPGDAIPLGDGYR